jgi:hypothetical protein
MQKAYHSICNLFNILGFHMYWQEYRVDFMISLGVPCLEVGKQKSYILIYVTVTDKK